MKARTFLGIHSGHSSSVALMVEGEVTYSIQEERLVYQKNASGWPARSIAQALAFSGLRPDDFDGIALTGRRHFLRARQPRDHNQVFSARLSLPGLAFDLAKTVAASVLHFPGRRLNRLHADGFAKSRARLVDHHQCHAAAAYYGLRRSSDAPYLVLTLDGAGDELCASISIARDNRLERVASTHYFNSLGAIYSTMTFLMGFEPMEHEYKLMGMAAYASPRDAERAAAIFHRYLEVDVEHCSFRRKVPEPMFQIARRLQRDTIGWRFDHLCAGLQLFTERLMVQWVQAAIRKYGIRSILCGGGVFMNVKANKVLAELPEVELLDVFPSCGDETNPIGACYELDAMRYPSEHRAPLRTFYLGDSVDDGAAEAEIQRRGLSYVRINDIEARVAAILATGEPVARVKGRMELGARALCNRSILADPAVQDNVRTLNHAVKKRDFWMPFAPVMREQDQDRYVKNPKRLASPYMMLAFDTRENFREMIAAVHNADLSARAQILRPGDNPDVERILSEFHRITGRGVLLNTSYNLHGFPICYGPKESLDVFQNSGLKFLALNNFLVEKPDREGGS